MALGNLLAENNSPYVKDNKGIRTKLPVALTGTAATLAVGGTSTFTGVATFTATPVFTAGTPRGFVSTSADTIAITAAQTGTVFLSTKSSATQVYTLPAVAAGLTYTFICGHASGETLVNPTGGTVGTVFTTFAAVGVDADTAIVTLTSGTGFKNTAATNAIGDSITIVSDGVGWYGVGITSGIWATQ